MMKRLFATLTGLALLCTVSWAGEVRLNDEKAKESYSLGYDFGSNLKRQGVNVDADILTSAVREGLQGKAPDLSPDDIHNTLLQLRKKLMALQEQRFREFSAKNLEEGKAFLEANKKKDGIKTLPSGLQYKVLREGNGPIPEVKDSLKVHYRGTLIDGTEVDDSHRKGGPATVNLMGVMKGWQEALQLMKTGSKWQLFIPPELGYGQRPFNSIPPNSVLIFEIELVAVN